MHKYKKKFQKKLKNFVKKIVKKSKIWYDINRSKMLKNKQKTVKCKNGGTKMKNKILKKLLSVILIIMLISTDFFVLGSTLVSYAINLNSSTNNANIEFSVYFKDPDGVKVSEISENIKRQDLKLYAEIKVKNEGYLLSFIEIENSNFKIKDNISSDSKFSVEGNKINLNQINALKN